MKNDGDTMIRTAIYGYGNLGRGVEAAVTNAADMELVGVFTRRDPDSVKTVSGCRTFAASEIMTMKDDIDVVIICGGSATDLPVITPELAGHFTVVDSFDNHSCIPEHFEKVNRAALTSGNLAVISGGWDPGLFSVARLLGEAVLPEGATYTFWGRGVSQGHSDAIRRIPGVIDARQYTVPVEESMHRVLAGECPELTTRQKHTRECFVALKPGTDEEKVRETIVTMPGYFADYDTTVNFVTEEELKTNHTGLPHGGRVIRSGITGLNGENRETVSFSLELESNPQFTGAVVTALARAAVRLKEKGETGCRTIFDIPLGLLSPKSAEELRKTIL